MFDGKVFKSANKNIREVAEINYRPDTPVSAVAALPEKDPGSSVHENDNAGAVVFPFPPPGRNLWSLSRLWLACKLWLLDRLIRAQDSGVRDKSVEILLDRHEASVKLLEARYSRQKLWYLEVVAVHPSLQSRGLVGA
ncbi:Acyl-CoA N-acyltransferase [Penicillium samsonianum]|uniref:Acyl-CoA N-acyltransferase n=1 Tax=Penicillium samsonianum TaxID=1882272 RepID=UPI002549B9E5|nr:Acyl-CoA N-acyltransferase [Penicillium samsonianum]KAJ6133445.1 Acyl-CoA N-acyltransferase [Penicillium samsonianum]